MLFTDVQLQELPPWRCQFCSAPAPMHMAVCMQLVIKSSIRLSDVGHNAVVQLRAIRSYDTVISPDAYSQITFCNLAKMDTKSLNAALQHVQQHSRIMMTFMLIQMI
jgi:hypothetical protein